MAPFTQRSFKAAGVRSLCWRGDELVDWVGGGRAFALSGIERESSVHYAYRFDAATASPDGRFVAIYERLGTKGLLLHDGKLLRELDRSHYFADAYEYPVALFDEPGGRLLLAHCPRRYNCIELDEVVTGDSLTASAERSPSDFFHSRLAASPSGKRLLSAGWVWHPLGVVEHFDIARALEDPHHLDCGDPLPHSAGGCLAEVSSACWLGDDHVAVASSGESDDRPNSHEDGQPGLRPRGLAVYDLANRTCIRAFRLDEPPGTILAIGTRHVLSLYRHPKLIDLSTGKVAHTWTDLGSGLQDGSILSGLGDDARPPAMAFDPVTNRFAIVGGDAITVIEFNPTVLNPKQLPLQGD
jgi:hypothetical protein